MNTNYHEYEYKPITSIRMLIFSIEDNTRNLCISLMPRDVIWWDAGQDKVVMELMRIICI